MYFGGIASWVQAALHNLDVMTRKQFTLHGGFLRDSDIGCLYIPRKLGESDLLAVKYAVEHEKLVCLIHSSF